MISRLVDPLTRRNQVQERLALESTVMRQIAALADADLFCSFSEASGTGAETANAGGFRSILPLTPVSWGDSSSLETSARWRLKE